MRLSLRPKRRLRWRTGPVEAQAEHAALSKTAVGFFENAENFELANDVLNWDALTSELAVMGDLCLT